MYWACEGVTEGYTFASAARKKKNKLIHPNNGKNGIMEVKDRNIIGIQY